MSLMNINLTHDLVLIILMILSALLGIGLGFFIVWVLK